MKKDRMTIYHEGAARLELAVRTTQELPVANRPHADRLSGIIWIAALLAIASMGLAAEIRPANIQKPDGSIVLLATNAVVHGQNIRYEPPVHKNTIGYWTRAEDWVSWDFQVNAPGRFDVMLTQSCGKGSGGSEVAIRVGEQVIQDLVPDTGSFTSWTNRVIGTFSFQKPGAYTVEVKPLKKPGVAVMDLRAITLTPRK